MEKRFWTVDAYVGGWYLWFSAGLKGFQLMRDPCFTLAWDHGIFEFSLILDFQSQEELCNFWSISKLSETAWKILVPTLNSFPKIPDGKVSSSLEKMWNFQEI